jgi:hypothetical protein
MTDMRTRLQQALVRLWQSLRRRMDTQRDGLACAAEGQAGDGGSRSLAVTRGRFWAELREGQREAANRAKLMCQSPTVTTDGRPRGGTRATE